MIKQPLVSIITPTYNSFSFIDETIRSIINQTYANWELLITDDCSTDETWNKLKKYTKKDRRIQIYQLSNNSGSGVARNNSISKANGRFIAFCDSDDLWKPSKLKKQINFMLENELILSYTSYDVINEKSNIIGEVIAPKIVNYKKMLKNDYIGCLTAMYDTQIIGKRYMPNMKRRQDWALWLDILKLTNHAKGMQEKLAMYRKRNNSISSNKFLLIKYNWNVYKKVENFSFIKSVFLIHQFIFYYFKKNLS